MAPPGEPLHPMEIEATPRVTRQGLSLDTCQPGALQTAIGVKQLRSKTVGLNEDVATKRSLGMASAITCKEHEVARS